MDVGEGGVGSRKRRPCERGRSRTRPSTLVGFPLVDVMGQVRARRMVGYWERFGVFSCNNRIMSWVERLSFGPRRSLASIGERPEGRLPIQLLLALFSRNQMPSEDPGLLLVGEFLGWIFVSTRGGSCATSSTSWGLHTNSTEDRGSSRTGTL
jgi:hypothetical protein